MDKDKLIKIAGIACSPHRDGMTAQLLRQALDGVKSAGAEVWVESLVDVEMEPCIGCGGNCWETLECIQSQGKNLSGNSDISDFNAMSRRLQEADGIIMAVPVYCWQMNSLTHLFIDKMRWDTGSILEPRNRRAAFGIACAGGSGTGCVLALQALYRYFYNWAFHGIKPLPVTRFNFGKALEEAYAGGVELVETIQRGLQPFSGLGAATADIETLPYMTDGPVDELRMVVQQLKDSLPESSEPQMNVFHEEAKLGEEAFAKGDRHKAADHFGRAWVAFSEI
ncbi:MAG: NAD(P)H-dependent oxidoreductase [Saccharofermentanales bacterium]